MATHPMTDAVQTLPRVASEIGPVLREHASETETGRRLAAPAMAALREAGLFRMLLPRSLGGQEADPVTFAQTVEAVAREDSAAAWALQANLGHWWAARYPEEGVEEIYGDGPDAMMAAAFHPPVAGVSVDGGYRLTGRRPLASTVHDAQWLFVTALAGQEAIGAIVAAADVAVLDTWYSLGMRGTDSNDVELQDAFVPARRTFPLMPAYEPGAHFGGPLYRMSAVAMQAAVLAPIALGAAAEAVDALRALAPSKTSLGTMRTLRDRPTTHIALARAEGLVRAGRALLHATLQEAWGRAVAGEEHTMAQRAGDLLAGAHAVRSAVEAVNAVYGVAGSAAVYERSPIERHFRDVQTIRHHGFVCEGRLEAVGQVLLGMEPEFVLLGL